MQRIHRPPFRIAGQTHPGVRRRQRPNEDAILLLAPEGEEQNHWPPLIAVADGMGGYGGGALASQTVLQTLADFYRQNAGQMPWEQLLETAIQEAHQEVRRQGVQQQLPDMGCTLVAALLFPRHFIVANIGDSRAYVLREGRLVQVTQDHSVVAQLVREGEITEYEALHHPHRNRLTQSISARRPSVHPDIQQEPWNPDDQILLCSDGLWGVVPESVLQEILRDLPPEESVQRLVALANHFQGPDNISVIVARREPLPDEETAPQPPDDEDEDDTRA